MMYFSFLGVFVVVFFFLSCDGFAYFGQLKAGQFNNGGDSRN